MLLEPAWRDRSESRVDGAESPPVTAPVSHAFVGLGSNLGDRRSALTSARSAIGLASGVEVVAASRVYETEPVGPGEQGLYLNAVIEIETTLAPRALLDLLLSIERRLGRDRGRDTVRWGPRTIDLDLLLYADLRLDEPGLELPHPRLHERPFVLAPLVELAGDLPHPRLGGRLADWLARCPGRETARPLHDLGPDDWAPGR